ncbi:alpha/beta hydrolase [Dongia rigui]|uniref:Alpha/beta hydrolase n=1 Tax=Dongia rigui TaxID=940149 RepID=A0ABU5E412_9PROT|nr:alpha/beta hydrolase [Dongia rigui]MDY0873934.1 alpha/beta hydrolase [Dongia rigui]
MTLYVSLRQSLRAGSVTTARVFAGRAGSTDLTPVEASTYPTLFRGKDVLLAAHGFNVSGAEGINALGWLEARLQPRAGECFAGVLWPGDWWIPAVNYPAEAADAVQSGKHLAAFCNKHLKDARSLSLLSHSLGGRVMLETAKRLVPVSGRETPARVICLTAAAVDNDCLTRQYATVPGQCRTFANLASNNDRVLKYAYPAGDFFSDLFGDNDSPWSGALGLKGPKGAVGSNVHASQIPDTPPYDHGNYLPPSASTPPAATNPPQLWERAADFMARAFRDQTQTWP